MYCQGCGALHEYLKEKPNFCQKCGGQFAHAAVEGEKVEVSLGKGGSMAHMPINIKALDVEIELDQRRNTMTLGDLMKTVDPNSKQPAPLGDRPGKPEGTDVLKEFQREAGSLKQRPPEPE